MWFNSFSFSSIASIMSFFLVFPRIFCLRCSISLFSNNLPTLGCKLEIILELKSYFLLIVSLNNDFWASRVWILLNNFTMLTSSGVSARCGCILHNEIRRCTSTIFDVVAKIAAACGTPVWSMKRRLNHQQENYVWR